MITFHQHHCSLADNDYGPFKLMGLNCQAIFISLVEKYILPFAAPILLLLCMLFYLYVLSGASVKTVPSYMDKLKFASFEIPWKMILSY